MAETRPQDEAMDVLQAWLEDYNARARPALPLGSKGEAGGAQLRLKYAPAEGRVSILHLVAVERDGRPTILARRFEGLSAETTMEAGLWASSRLGRRPAC